MIGSNLTIRQKLGWGFGTVGAIFALTVGASAWKSQTLDKTLQQIATEQIKLTTTSADLETKLNASLAALRGYALTATTTLRDERASLWKQIEEDVIAIDALAGTWSNEESAKQWAQFKNELRDLRTAQERAERLILSNNPERAIQLMGGEIDIRSNNLLTLLSGEKNASGLREGGLQGQHQQLLTSTVLSAGESTHNLMLLEWLFLFLGLGLGAFIALNVIRAIASPLHAMAENTEKLANGMEANLPDSDAQDEIGALSRALHTIRDTGLQNARLRSSMEGITSNVMIADENNNIVYVNPAVVDTLRAAQDDIRKDLPNFDAEKLIGVNIDDFHKKPEHQRNMLKNLTDTYSTSITVGGRIFDLVASPATSPDGKRLGTVVEWSDVTEKRALEERSTRIQTSLDCVSSSVMMADENNVIIYVNPAVVATLKAAEEDIRKDLPNFNAEKLIGVNIDDFHKNPEHQRNMLAKLDGTYETSITVGGRIFDLVANPVNNTNGARLGTVVEWKDVTEQRALEERSARIQTSLDCVSSNVMLADENYNIIYMNEAVLKMFQAAESDIRQDLPDFNANKLIGINIDSFHKDPSHQRGLLNTLTDTYRSTLKVGGRSFTVVANPVLGSEGQRLGTVVEWGDITQQLAIEGEVQTIVDASLRGDFEQRLTLEEKEGFMLNLSKGINQLMDVVSEGLTNIGNVMETLERGDLTKTMDGDYDGAFAAIQSTSNNMIHRLRDMVGKIIETAESVTNAAQEIAAGSTDLSARTEEQASNLEETAASMEQLTATVRQNSENADNANGLSGKARTVALKGGDVVEQAVGAMKNIEESSNKIADIISVIDEIAFQTNLLALNAAVEAARAGEAGKGFAVVASEVRTLAGRSASASKEIKQLINESGQEVKAGANLVNQAGDTLTDIVEAIKEVADIMQEIASASAEQSTGIDEINSAITQMDEVTQQNAALVEENTAAAQSMEDQARGLDQLISFFTVDQHASQSSVANTEQPEPAEESTPRQEPPKVVTPIRKAAAGGSAQQATQEDFEDGWEEF